MPNSSSAVVCLIVIVTLWGPGELAAQANPTGSSTSSSSTSPPPTTTTTPTTTPPPTAPTTTPPPTTPTTTPTTTNTTMKPPPTITTGTTTAAANQVISTATSGTKAPTTGSSSTDSPTSTSMTTTPGDPNDPSTAIPSSSPNSQSKGLDEKSEIAIVVVSILGASALIVVFVAVISMRLNRPKKEPRGSMEMANMNGYPSRPLPSNHSSVASGSNASGSRATVTLSIEPLVHG